MFQFQIGAIGSLKAAFPLMDNISFNSRLVRLAAGIGL